MQHETASRRLRRRIEADEISRLVGAHNALGARMAQRAGFDGVWSSGLELSASYGVPDSSLIGLNEHLSALQAMTYCLPATPIVADGDTGYGDACNVAYTVRKFEAAGVAGLAIEDKCFPKHNSFQDGSQDLLPVDRFAAKIESARHARKDPDFVLIARTEALIAGAGPDEALRRAHAYADAGADAILFHSKAPTVEPVRQVLERWDRRLPVVLVPTTYPDVDLGELRRLGVRVVIYANHGLRSSLRAMERTYAEILASGGTTSVEPFLWPLSSVFDLQDGGHPQNGHRPIPKATTNGSAPAIAPPERTEPPDQVDADFLCDRFLAEGLDFFAGVPDSTLKGLFLALERRDDTPYLPAVTEEAAVGLAVGAHLGGRSPVLLMQNSGLGTAVTALASLALPYEIPLVLVVGWRGIDGDDAPEHHVLGEATPGLLRTLGIPFTVLDPGRAEKSVARVVADARSSRGPAALVVRLRQVR